MTLDREVFLESNHGDTDLRLVAGRDREVPYQLVTLEKAERSTPVSVTIRDLGHVEGEYSTFVADVGASGNLHSEVDIDTGGHNFRRTVIVETSFDGETWAVAQENGEIYDFTSSDREFRVRHTSVRYPQSAARYLRVKVLNGGEPHLKITGATVYLAEEVAARETDYLPTSVSVTRDEYGTTRHLLDLGSGGVPISRLSFRSDTPNFYRGAGVEGSDDGEEWQWLGGESIYSFDTPKFVGSLLELELRESRYRYYRLAVDDADNPPLSLTGYTLHSADRLLRFQAEPNTDYALYYGNPVAEAPVYDLGQVVALPGNGEFAGGNAGGPAGERGVYRPGRAGNGTAALADAGGRDPGSSDGGVFPVPGYPAGEKGVPAPGKSRHRKGVAPWRDKQRPFPELWEGPLVLLT